MSEMEEKVLDVLPRFFDEYTCAEEAFLAAWKFCWKNVQRNKASPVDMKESVLDDKQLMTEAKNILEEISKIEKMEEELQTKKMMGNAEAFVVKAGFEYCAKFTQPFLYQVVRMNEYWHRSAMLFILGACVKQADKDKQNNQLRQYIVGEIYKFVACAVAKCYVKENAAIWAKLGEVIGLLALPPYFTLDMFEPIFIYADSQEPENCITYELLGHTMVTLNNFDRIEQPIPLKVNCLIMQFCPNLLDSGDVTRLCKLHYFVHMVCDCSQCEKHYCKEESCEACKRETAEVGASRLKDEGNVHYSNQCYHSAVATYTRAIQKYPKDVGLMATLHSNRAASHMMLCNYDTALEDCTEALKFNPEYKKAYIRGCECLLLLHAPDVALEWLDKYDIDIGDKFEDLKTKAKAGLKCCKKGVSGNKKGKTKVEQNNNVGKHSLMDILKSHDIQFIPDLDRFVSGGGDLKDTVHLDEQGELRWNVTVRYPTPVLQTAVKDFSETCSMRQLLQTALAQTSGLDADVYSEHTVTIQYKDLTHVTVYKPDDVTMRTVHNLDVTLGDVLSRSDYTVVNMLPLFYVVIS